MRSTKEVANLLKIHRCKVPKGRELYTVGELERQPCLSTATLGRFNDSCFYTLYLVYSVSDSNLSPISLRFALQVEREKPDQVLGTGDQDQILG